MRAWLTLAFVVGWTALVLHVWHRPVSALEDYPTDPDAPPPIRRGAPDPLSPHADELEDDEDRPTNLDGALARSAAQHGTLETWVKRINLWHARHGNVPKGLSLLLGPLERDLPTDPWGLALDYEALGEHHYVLRSAGPDGLFDTEDDLVRDEVLKKDDAG